MAAENSDLDPIVTARLRLRMRTPGDAFHFERLLGGDSDALQQMAQMPDPCTEPAAREWIEARIGPGGHVFAIERLTDGEFLGIAGFGGHETMPELGYWIGRPFRGQGFATEAIRGVIGYARAIGIPRLHADTFPNNPASARALAKAGFVTIGTADRDFPARGGIRRLNRHVYEIEGRRRR
jgi:[ribosomal protein S5]-alanine N-acetyltransferase